MLLDHCVLLFLVRRPSNWYNSHSLVTGYKVKSLQPSVMESEVCEWHDQIFTG